MSRSARYLILMLVLLVSCSKDEFIPCDCDRNNPGTVCREYKYENDTYIGYIDYKYDPSHNLTEKRYFSPNGLSKYIRYQYSPMNKLLRESHYSRNNNLENYYLYTYNSFDSIASSSYYEHESLINKSDFQYNTARLLSRRLNYQGEKLSGIEKSDYDDQNVLWKQTLLTPDSTLISYKIFEFFNNHFERISCYDQEGNFSGYSILQYTGGNKLVLVRHYDRYKEFSGSEVFEYKDNMLIKYSVLDAYGLVLSYNVYQYN